MAEFNTVVVEPMIPGVEMSSISSLVGDSVNMSSAKLKAEVNTAVVKKALDSQRVEGEALLDLIEQSAPTSRLQGSIDKVRGQNIDIYA